MHSRSDGQHVRRIRARNLVLIVIFASVLATGAATSPSADRIRPFLLALVLTLCAKLVVEYLFGLPMRFLAYVQLQASEPAARRRVLVGMVAAAGFTLYLFYFGPQGHA
jgi:antibiotic biosynthesis monooxygenase (ABM) superfamily enzyme